MATTRHEAGVREMDRALAPGSETILLGHALLDIRRSPDPDAALAWWVGAYAYLEWAEGRDDEHERTGYDDAASYILESGDDLTGWAPPAPTPSDLRAWREAEGLTLVRAAKLAGVDLRTWQRWEGAEVPAPQWLRDTLRHRWGSCP